MTHQDNYLAKVFPEPPITAFKRHTNLRDMLIRAKVPEPKGIYEQRQKNGMKCARDCTPCPLSGRETKLN